MLLRYRDRHDRRISYWGFWYPQLGWRIQRLPIASNERATPALSDCQCPPSTFVSDPNLDITIHFCESEFRWGSPEFIGLGFLSFVTIILTELFGSPFLKNASIIVGLAVGCIVAGATGYIDGSSIKSAPAITFLWYRPFRNDWYTFSKLSKGSFVQDRCVSRRNSTYAGCLW